MNSHLAVPKTYKLYIGGAFPRSESGRTFEVADRKGRFLANAAKASRKDARDAVVAARAAVAGWSAATAYNRGQVLYRIAELLEGRREQFVAELRAAGGLTQFKANQEVDAAIDVWIWYAGWADKYLQVVGNGNAVSGPYFNISTPEPTGVVAIIAPQGELAAGGGLLGLASVLAPVLVSGNTAVLVANEAAPLPAISLAEVLATSDVPGGVVNILTGSAAEIAPWLASHSDVNGLDLAGAGELEWVDLQISAAETLKRVLPPEPGVPAPSIERIRFFTETKTVWHTKAII
ncbi:MAG: aldehyde dehydrogenase family protein [Cryobacterium sp.]|nr:aldehyde dehydrogenase family protein [Cryobacterium sp.]